MKAALVFQKIRFDRSHAPAPGVPDGRSAQRPWIASDETLIAPEPATADAAEDTTDCLRISWITGGTAADRQSLMPAIREDRSKTGGTTSVSSSPAPVATILFEDQDAIVEWRPGHAIVRSPLDLKPELLAALIDFAFFEGALRQLESALPGCEADTGSA